MKITLFVEGSPGHEKQSLAVIGELKRKTDVVIERVDLSRVSRTQKIKLFFSYFLLPDGGCPLAECDSDILLGTGSKTHFSILAAKKKFNIPAVICMAPDSYLLNRFDLCFVPRHDGLTAGDTVFLTDGPPVSPVNGESRNSRKGLILIGGPIPQNDGWSSEDICSCVEKIILREADVHWSISTSPRTPEETAEELKQLADSRENLIFYHFRDTPKGWIEEKYGESEFAWITVDSMSMVYEALTAGCRIGLLPLKWKSEHTKHQLSMSFLAERDLAVSFENWSAGKELSDRNNTFNEAQRCADEIMRRWDRKV